MRVAAQNVGVPKIKYFYRMESEGDRTIYSYTADNILCTRYSQWTMHCALSRVHHTLHHAACTWTCQPCRSPPTVSLLPRGDCSDQQACCQHCALRSRAQRQSARASCMSCRSVACQPVSDRLRFGCSTSSTNYYAVCVLIKPYCSLYSTSRNTSHPNSHLNIHQPSHVARSPLAAAGVSLTDSR